MRTSRRIATGIAGRLLLIFASPQVFNEVTDSYLQYQLPFTTAEALHIEPSDHNASPLRAAVYLVPQRESTTRFADLESPQVSRRWHLHAEIKRLANVSPDASGNRLIAGVDFGLAGVL